MLDKKILDDILEDYKKDFVTIQWNEERYKWEAIKCFQDNWDVNAEDFFSMLELSLSKTGNLLVSNMFFAGRMINEFAKVAPEEIRSMFIDLFSEKESTVDRIQRFKAQSDIVLDKYSDATNHYQNEYTISIYLWLRYPDIYYIYKFGVVKAVSDYLDSSYKIKKGDFRKNTIEHLDFYGEINDKIVEDKELIQLFQSQLDDKCYPDPNFTTLTADICIYIYKKDKESKKSTTEWFDIACKPGITKEEWITLLDDKSVFTTSSLEIMKRFKDNKGQGTCKQLSIKYGESVGFYNLGSTNLAKRVLDKLGRTIDNTGEENRKLWVVLYVGKKASKDEDGVFVWKLRDELSQALDIVDLTNVNLFPVVEQGDCNYWWLNASPKIWSYNNIAVGESQSYTLYNSNGNKRRIFQNFLDAKVGDIIIGYESNPIKKVVALCKVTAESDGQQIYIEKTESLSSPIPYSFLKESKELENMEYFQNSQGSLFKVTKDEYDFIFDIIREENPVTTTDSIIKYDKNNFLSEVYMSEQKYDKLSSILKSKKNIILQGAPGVGKTFSAKRLAYSIMGVIDEERVKFIQFHQNYSYEDFIMGYKPVNDGFELKNGIFYEFCQKASNNPTKDYYFIIDEINRGNMSKIFGELLMLIENDYRGVKATLAYNGLSFYVPKNLYIIGMMNTADRSLSMIDYALRRRFSFFEIEPGFETKGFNEYQKNLNNEMLDIVINKIIELNNEIRNDKSLGKGFCIGHSYFTGLVDCDDETLELIIEHDVLPMLLEYWFDDENKYKKWENTLRGIFQ